MVFLSKQFFKNYWLLIPAPILLLQLNATTTTAYGQPSQSQPSQSEASQPQSSVRDAAMALNSGGLQKESKGDKAGALAYYSKAINADPSYVQPYVNRAHILLAMDAKAAIADLDIAIKLDPNKAFFWVNRADAKYSLQDYPGAIADCEHALSLEQKNVNALFQLGQSNYRMKQYKIASDTFSKVLDLNPRFSLALMLRGFCYAQSSAYQSAIDDFKKAIEINPPLANRADIKEAMSDCQHSLDNPPSKN